jgi:hypothetical protein
VRREGGGGSIFFYQHHVCRSPSTRLIKRPLTVRPEFRRPDSVRHSRQIGADRLRNLQPVPQHPERAPCSSTAGSKDLRGVLAEHVDRFGVDDGVEGGNLVREDEVVESAWTEEGVGQRTFDHASVGVLGRGELVFVVVVSELLELVEITSRRTRDQSADVYHLPVWAWDGDEAHWLPNSLAAKRNPLLRMQRAEAVGMESKYLILSERTSSSLCSIVTLYRSPSSD